MLRTGEKRALEDAPMPLAKPSRVDLLRDRILAQGGPVLGELVGCGASSWVFRLPDQPATVAKVMLDSMPGGAFAGVEKQERAVARLLGMHSRLVTAERLSWYGPYACLLMPRCEQSLEQLLKARRVADGGWKPLPLQERHRYMRHLLDALAFCHARQLVHRDVKPANLLLDEHGNLRLADFGLARVFGAEEAAAGGRHLSAYSVVTLWYRALEVLFANEGACCFEYDYRLDVWSAGCVYAELVQPFVLFRGDSSIEMVRRICAELGAPDAQRWSLGYHAVGSLLGKHPQRPAAPLARLGEVLIDAELQLLLRLLTPEPMHRIGAAQALMTLVQMPLVTKTPLAE